MCIVYLYEEWVSTYTSLTLVSDIFPCQVTDILKERDILVEKVESVTFRYDILLLVCCIADRVCSLCVIKQIL